MKSIYSPEYRRMLLRMRQARQAAGLTQAAVARRFQRPQSFVSQCESGERRIDPTELLRLAGLYRRKVADFLDAGERRVAGRGPAMAEERSSFKRLDAPARTHLLHECAG